MEKNKRCKFFVACGNLATIEAYHTFLKETLSVCEHCAGTNEYLKRPALRTQTVEEMLRSMQADLKPDELKRLGVYLDQRVETMEAGKKVSREMGVEYTVPDLLRPIELIRISQNLERAFAAQKKRDRQFNTRQANKLKAEKGKTK